jgi:hypothetical protein
VGYEDGRTALSGKTAYGFPEELQSAFESHTDSNADPENQIYEDTLFSQTQGYESHSG